MNLLFYLFSLCFGIFFLGQTMRVEKRLLAQWESLDKTNFSAFRFDYAGVAIGRTPAFCVFKDLMVSDQRFEFGACEAP